MEQKISGKIWWFHYNSVLDIFVLIPIPTNFTQTWTYNQSRISNFSYDTDPNEPNRTFLYALSM